MEAAVADLFRSLARAEYFRALTPLEVSEGGMPHRPGVARVETLRESAGIAVGHTSAPPHRIEAMRLAVLAMTEAGLPGVFAYVYDAFWEIASDVAALAASLARVPAESLALAPDVWAFAVPPGKDHRGWAPHRGVATPNRTAEGRVRVVNAWLALSPARRESSCLFLVPLDRDPHVPASLDELPDASLGEAHEVEPGTVLLWDANVAHWGGASSEAARGPRVSATYTLFSDPCEGAVRLADLTYERRLELIANQICTYAAMDGKVAPAVVGWAQAWSAIARAARGATC